MRTAVLAAVLAALRAERGPVLVAFSGGLDSTVLLHAAVTAGRELGVAVSAIHVHHGLQAAARAWPGHCRQVAESLGVPLAVVDLPPAQPAGQGLEAWARRARYAAIEAEARRVGAGRVLVAHHADDQAETVLLRLARGAGLRGLGAMVSVRALGTLSLLRPLLALPRAALLEYARAHALHAIEDPSNADRAHARNRVRLDVLPALAQAAPGAAASLTRAAALAAEAQAVLDEVAAADLGAARAQAQAVCGHAPAGVAAVIARAVPGSVLMRPALAGLGEARQRLALRAWLQTAGRRMPTLAQLEEARRQMLTAASAQGRVLLDGLALCRFRDWLWLEPERPVPKLPVGGETVRWAGEARLAAAGGWLCAQLTSPDDAAAIDEASLRAGPLQVLVPSAATRLRLRPGGVSRSLKHWHQQFGVPARLRSGLPAIVLAGEIRWAAGLGAVWQRSRVPAERTGAAVDMTAGARAWRLRWEPAQADDPRSAICALQHRESPQV